MLTEKPKSHAKSAHASDAGADLIRLEMERILESTAFKGTSRRRKLLRYLVEELLAGRGGELKGYSIATLVFDRDDSFDPQADPVVRLEARRLRHDLDGYYASAGRESPLRITIPKGQYAPVIEWGEPGSDLPEPPAVTTPGADATSSAAPVVGQGDGRVSRFHGIATVAVLALLIVLFGAIAYLFMIPDTSVADNRVVENGASLVVLPFETEAEIPKAALLSTGMADEIMAGLSRFGGVRLYLPPGNAGKLSGNDPIVIGNNLNLSYVVSGNIDVDAQNARLAVSSRLIEVKTQRILWIGSYDRDYSAGSLRSVQLDIANSIASALGQPYGILRNADAGRIGNQPAMAMSSYECVLQAYTYRRSLTRPLHAPALSCLQAAVKRDPRYGDAWGMLAWLYMDEARFGWVEDGGREEAYRRAVSTAQNALDIDPDNIVALKAMSSTLHYTGDFADSQRLMRKAYALNPNDPDTLAQLGWRLAIRGNFKEGIPFLKQAIERSINPPGWYFHLLAIDQYLNGRYQEMLASARRSTVDGSGISWSLVAIAEGALGQPGRAREALMKMAEKSPTLAQDPASVYRRHQAIDRIVEALVSGLREAGWHAASAAANPI